MCWHHFCTHLCCGLECLRGIVTCPVQCSVTDNGGAGRPSNWVWCLAWSCSLSSCAPCVTSCLFCIATISASIWPSSWTGCAGCGSNIVNGVLAPLVTPVRTQDTQCACDGFYSQLRARFFFFSHPVSFPAVSTCSSLLHVPESLKKGECNCWIASSCSASLPGTAPLSPLHHHLLCSRVTDNTSATCC